MAWNTKRIDRFVRYREQVCREINGHRNINLDTDWWWYMPYHKNLPDAWSDWSDDHFRMAYAYCRMWQKKIAKLREIQQVLLGKGEP